MKAAFRVVLAVCWETRTVLRGRIKYRKENVDSSCKIINSKEV